MQAIVPTVNPAKPKGVPPANEVYCNWLQSSTQTDVFTQRARILSIHLQVKAEQEPDAPLPCEGNGAQRSPFVLSRKGPVDSHGFSMYIDMVKMDSTVSTFVRVILAATAMQWHLAEHMYEGVSATKTLSQVSSRAYQLNPSKM